MGESLALEEQKIHVAVNGCGHGSLDSIYEQISSWEEENNLKVDILLICGDFQAIRNEHDLEFMHCPPKYLKLGDFYKYYNGTCIAPVLTVFIGGNHEASNFLHELHYGGWVCPNIYFLGYSNVLDFAGLKIAGISGIFDKKKKSSLNSSHQHSRISRNDIKFSYYYREPEYEKLFSYKDKIDIFLSHDWPQNVYFYGNQEGLLRRKPFFRTEMESGQLGSPILWNLMKHLKPKYWFSAHLHCEFNAELSIDGENIKFQALDKLGRNRKNLTIFSIPGNRRSLSLLYDESWLRIQRQFCNAAYSSANTTSTFESKLDSLFLHPPGFDERILNRFNIQTVLYCQKLGITLPEHQQPDKTNIDEINLL